MSGLSRSSFEMSSVNAEWSIDFVFLHFMRFIIGLGFGLLR